MEMRCVMPRLGSASAEATAASEHTHSPGSTSDGRSSPMSTAVTTRLQRRLDWRGVFSDRVPTSSIRQSVPRHGAARRARRDRRARAASTARVARHRRPRPVAGEPRRVRDARGGGAAGVRRGELDPGLRAHRTVGRRRRLRRGRTRPRLRARDERRAHHQPEGRLRLRARPPRRRRVRQRRTRRRR